MQNGSFRLSAGTKWILAIGGIVWIAGFLLNAFFSKEGKVLLEKGKEKNLVLKGSNPDTPEEETGLGLFISLDSVFVEPHEPAFEILVYQQEAASEDKSETGAISRRHLTGQFPLELMEIQKVGDTDFRFRVKDFYPDFGFSYSYPDQRDTIEPRAPGILLELLTNEGPAAVTLRTDQPNKHMLGDIVDLGTSFAFYWELPPDRVMSTISEKDTADCKVVFSGSDQQIYFVTADSFTTTVLEENRFYSIPGKDSLGFTITYCFPDVAYLQAVPATKSDEPVNPVANVEIWKLGGTGLDVFLYPEKRGRSGGRYTIPETEYELAMEVSPEEAIQYCHCSVSVSGRPDQPPGILHFKGDKVRSFRGYQLQPVACTDMGRGEMVLLIRHRPGNLLFFAGIAISVISFFTLGWSWRRNRE